ncbi:ABC transporter ATP-binding protein [Leptospira sp. 2 VSF19]|uniref:ABC transporter ATP-binding protein n=1 Tax=Leptospira soteropolitanensis TaxID=2950025 RepID=A0AAW5VIC3_9LEPT|nr:ABC transporter ATP-binding protein [Leptospira soteropolitanensis]MCW7493502.1 ABC transporter ATP-binding protein [Leptospira soteropolitanensis]MCW7500966.1 ABC transporter ATP-binding protein [Leptospira soteropolitanensis]MCW7523354.1 ABC transporter ATP-binding protein [Leptospira soteropolitanensis]MCW7527215.1 ABC transporter ATP-binding protein [Leptospira soteropolitanensis]MCW7531072.1 ABC transporter ATP-binding protein [Leptospira soteropolitanensis]
MKSILTLKKVSKSYDNGFQALKDVYWEVKEGEIHALLGPNGAGKTTLINLICGIVSPSSGEVNVDGFDIISDFKKTRSFIGLVPQELSVHAFETVWASVSFTRGLYGKPANPKYIEEVLKSLSLWDKKDQRIMTLSGGMKRRVLIAKALSHEPKILFLDEPSAGVDVELRKDMWKIVESLRKNGVTIILTTHYIEEAESIADRISVIRKGQIFLTEDKDRLMKQLGTKQLRIELKKNLKQIPKSLSKYELELVDNNSALVFTYDRSDDSSLITKLLDDLKKLKIQFSDLSTKQSSLEEIFVQLLQEAV